ncbi:MAG: ribosome-associated translation inhibitor RaiA [Parcubacteria group bacterium]|nr:ribosome-associated translation inhibitor RaiA [Parcubacteria group bacterium]
MKISIKGTNLDLTPAISEFIELKIGSLSRFIGAFDEKGVVEVKVEIQRTTKHHRRGDVFRAEANLRLPKKILRAEHSDADIRTAIDFVKNKLKLEIEKYKGKIREGKIRD